MFGVKYKTNTRITHVFLVMKDWVTLRCCRVVLSDHGAFVLINVYAPNAGPAPERPRAAYKCKFLQALHSKAVQLRDAGRQVSVCISSCYLALFGFSSTCQLDVTLH